MGQNSSLAGCKMGYQHWHHYRVQTEGAAPYNANTLHQSCLTRNKCKKYKANLTLHI